jgi:hypothetical protein
MKPIILCNYYMLIKRLEIKKSQSKKEIKKKTPTRLKPSSSSTFSKEPCLSYRHPL